MPLPIFAAYAAKKAAGKAARFGMDTIDNRRANAETARRLAEANPESAEAKRRMAAEAMRLELKNKKIERKSRLTRPRNILGVAALGALAGAYAGGASILDAAADKQRVVTISEGERDRMVTEVHDIKDIDTVAFETFTEAPELTNRNPVKLGPIDLPAENLTMRYENGIEAKTIVWYKPEENDSVEFDVDHSENSVVVNIPDDAIKYDTDIAEEHNEGEIFVSETGETYHNILDTIRSYDQLIGDIPFLGWPVDKLTDHIGGEEEVQELQNEMRTELDMRQVVEIEDTCGPKVLDSDAFSPVVQESFVDAIKDQFPQYGPYDMTIKIVEGEPGGIAKLDEGVGVQTASNSGNYSFKSGLRNMEDDSICRIPDDGETKESYSGGRNE